MTVKIVLINTADSGITDQSELEAVAEALTEQAQQHFALPPPHGYGIAAEVRVASTPFDQRAGEWPMVLLGSPDQPDALAYHWQTADGLPIMKIFTRLAQQYGLPWSSVASHEMVEALADPNCSRLALSWDGRLWAYETADAVEARSYRAFNGVWLSDFVLPPYFEPVDSLANLRLDWMGVLKSPLEIDAGGYGQWYDPRTGWHQVFSQQPVSAYRNHLLGSGRGHRRRTSAGTTTTP